MTQKVVKYTTGFELQDTANAIGTAVMLSAMNLGFGVQEKLFVGTPEGALTSSTAKAARPIRVTFEWADEQ